MQMSELSACALAVFLPPPNLSITEWADRYRFLSPEASSEPGKWNTSRAPYQAGIMDAVSDPNTHTVVLMTSAQIGKTAILENIVGYYISQDPSPILCLQPTLEMAATFSKDRMAPMLRDTPVLRGLVKEARSRDSGNTQLHKQFPGGHITMTGANSPANLASRPIRIVLCDEVDRYPESAGAEGDPVSLARKRSATFWNRKTVLTSTPTIKDLSRIERAYLGSDQRRHWVPCPYCSEYQILKWANVRWDEGKPETAHYVCEKCESSIDEQHKSAMLKSGEWRADVAFHGIAGFHINEIYSPWRRWSEIASDFLEAKNSGTETLKAWVNTSLGEVWEERGDQIDATGLITRLEEYDEKPKALARTAGVDVQKDRIEVTVVDWGDGEEAWTMDHIIIPGDTAQPDVWMQLDGELRFWAPEVVAIDSGYNTSMVYAFCEPRRWAVAVKGRAGPNVPIVENEKARRQRLRGQIKRGLTVHLIGDDQAKALIYSRLKIITPGPAYIHFPSDASFDDEYFAQLTAEKLVTKMRGTRPYAEWVQTRPRNEALDCWKYALAALRLSGINLELRAAATVSESASGKNSPSVPTNLLASRAAELNERIRARARR